MSANTILNTIFQETVINFNWPMLLDFWTSRCGSCGKELDYGVV